MIKTFIRLTLVAILSGVANVAHAGTYMDRAREAFENGNYEECIRLYDEGGWEEVKIMDKDYGPAVWARMDILPIVESYIAVGDYKKAYKAMTDKHRVINKNIWISGIEYHFKASDLEKWGEDKFVLLNKVIDRVLVYYRNKYDLFEKSPFLNRVISWGYYTRDRLKQRAADRIYEKVTDETWYDNSLRIDFLQSATEYGSIDAMIVCGNGYEQGKFIIPHLKRMALPDTIIVQKDYDEALKYWKMLSDRGDSYGDYKLGYYTLAGRGIEKNPAGAISYFKRVIDRKDSHPNIIASAYCNLSECLLQTGDTLQSFKNLKDGYDGGYYSVCYNLAQHYQNGYGTPKDPVKAFEIFSKGAENATFEDEKGFCQLQLAKCLKDGNGCEKDEKRAIELMEESYKKGVQFATLYLADWYYENKNYVKAKEKCLEVFNSEGNFYDKFRGHVCSLLSKMYRFGRGVKADEEEADKWLKLSYEYGDNSAAEIMKMLGL